MLNEQQLEELCLGWFQAAGWRYAYGPDIAPDSNTPKRTDYRQVVLRERLLTSLARINPHMPPTALEQAVHALLSGSEPQMVMRNRSTHRLLLNGVMVEFAQGDEKKTDLVHFLDFAQPANNDFLVVNQFTITGTKQPRRPDVIAFVNGLPLAVVELKNPANEQTDVWDAFNQLQTYKDEISDLFNSNAALASGERWLDRACRLAHRERGTHAALAHHRQRRRPAPSPDGVGNGGAWLPPARLVSRLRAALRAV
ncbi:type I site-specific restriction-modification system R (restriction) subunit [Duganella sp. HSC-15S17]|uniref:type I site-specific deoxyribonuclease n=1 Tax=Duganella violaceipulchra TaxID=2849652 RepID=A0ABT1GGG6_9BURK|nr:type I site-specific restriction-modification system R (restriction) subunit [Duganella violaceicalia]